MPDKKDDLLMADVRFGSFDFEDDIVVVAASQIEGRYVVGCGTSRKEALLNLFENAYPGMHQEFAPGAAWKIGRLED